MTAMTPAQRQARYQARHPERKAASQRAWRAKKKAEKADQR